MCHRMEVFVFQFLPIYAFTLNCPCWCLRFSSVYGFLETNKMLRLFIIIINRMMEKNENGFSGISEFFPVVCVSTNVKYLS